jgi:hypothetical protein
MAAEINAVRGLFKRCRGAAERAQMALDIIVSHAHAARGYLYIVEAEGRLKFAAPFAGVEPPEELAHELKDRLDELCRPDEQTRTAHVVSAGGLNTLIHDEADDELGAGHARAPHGSRCHAILLTTLSGERTIAVGAVSLVTAGDPLRQISHAVVQEVATALYEAADIRTVHFDAAQATVLSRLNNPKGRRLPRG